MKSSADKFMVLTTINAPTEAVLALARRSDEWKLIVVGDRKTPADWAVNGATFLSIETQRAMQWKILELLPENHYCRKNIGYLEALVAGATVIAETDDDNIPGNWPSSTPQAVVEGSRIAFEGWVNPYPYFTAERVWPRGLPLQHIVATLERRPTDEGSWRSAVHQYLAAGDPDVDAVYRMTVGKGDHTFADGSIVLAPGAMTTFNSQCTVWFPEAFPLLYLPSFVSFRMTDIWRSLVAQACLWAFEGQLSYHGNGVTQVRNEHDLLRDFHDEVVGYERNDEIRKVLSSLPLQPGPGAVSDNLRACYVALEAIGIVTHDELTLVDAWIADVEAALGN